MQIQPLTPSNGSKAKFRIRQQNTNKSLIAQTDMLHRADPKLFDIIAIQEPYLDHFHNTRASQHWYMVYPREHFVNPGKTRSVILMNKALAADAWTQVKLESSDVTAIRVQMARGMVLVDRCSHRICCGWATSTVTIHSGMNRGTRTFSQGRAWTGHRR